MIDTNADATLVYHYIHKRCKISSREISLGTSIPIYRVRRALRLLQDAGSVPCADHRESPAHTAAYHIIRWINRK